MTERSCVHFDPRRRPCCTECGLQVAQCTCEDPDSDAHFRLHSPLGQYLRDVSNITATVDVRSQLYPRLVSTLGQIGEKLVEHDRTRSPSPQDIYALFVQLGAIAAVFAAEGTSEYAYPAP